MATDVTPGNKQIELVNGGVEDVNNIPALRCLAVSNLFLVFLLRALQRGAASVQMHQIKGHRV